MGYKESVVQYHTRNINLYLDTVPLISNLKNIRLGGPLQCIPDNRSQKCKTFQKVSFISIKSLIK